MKTYKYLILVVVLILGNHFYDVVNISGIFRDIPKPTESVCKSIGPIIGPEDFALVEEYLFVSSTRLPPRFDYNQGDIYLIDLSSKEKKPISLGRHFKMSPHGIYAKKIKGIIKLWVINHTEEYDTVEIFNYSNGVLSHERSVRFNELVNLNDIAVANENSFYITHDHGSRNNVFKILEEYTLSSSAYVSYVSKGKIKRVVENLRYANGIEIIGDKVFVAEMLRNKISEYEIMDNQDLKLSKEIEIPFSPDNITLFNESEILVGTYPKLFSMQEYSNNPRKISPSSIIKINLKNNKLTRVFDESGKRISGVSVASIYKDKIYLGSVFDHFILECNLQYNHE